MAKQKKKERKFSSRAMKIIGLAVIVLLLLGLLVRSCTGKGHQEKIYRIGRDPSWYPLDFMGKERNMVAFSNDLFGMIAKEEHLKILLYSASRDDLMDGLNRGIYDAIVTSMDPNPMLEARYVFSDPIYLTGPLIVVMKNSDIRSFADLGGEMVAIQSGSPLVFRIRDYPTILFRTYENMREALDDLQEDEIDAVIMEALPAYANIESVYAGKLKIVGRPLTDEGLRLMAKKDPDSSAFILKFNEGLHKIIQDGSYDSLMTNWGIFDTLKLSDPTKVPKVKSASPQFPA